MKKIRTVEQAMRRKASVSRILRELDFADEAVSSASCKQGKLYEEVIRLRIVAMQDRMEAESALSLTKSELSLAVRKKYAGRATRVTEGFIDAKLSHNPELIRAQHRLQQKQLEEEYVKGLLEAYRMRSHATKVVASLVADQYYGGSEPGKNSQPELAAMRRKLASKYPGQQLNDDDD